MSKSKVVVVGAGPGGLTSAMILASKGYDVQVYEKQSSVGGRNARIQLGPYTFDTGPTFLMMLDILENAFQLAGRKMSDYLDVRSVDPLYRLQFADGRSFSPTRDREQMRQQIERMYPGDADGYDAYLAYEADKYERIASCLRVPYDSLKDYLRPRFLKALPVLDAHQSLYRHLGRFFKHDELKLAFTFQAKYLGMSPWNCPATFSIISFIEHSGGIHHPIGGLNRISQAMAKVVEEERGSIHLNAGVRELIIENGRCVGVILESGERVMADHVVLNADFGYAMNELVQGQHLRRWTPEKLERKGLSCSTFMLYLGIDGRYDDVPHHSIVFSSDYRKNVQEVADTLELSEDPSFYIQNASVTDPSLAPEGKSTIYILVPIPNTRSSIRWNEIKQSFRDKILELAETRGGLTGLRERIEVEKVITPADWERKYHVYRGAVFNLAHSIDQMLYFRPHNRFEEFDQCYLTGGGTHPGSGLPTIYQSGIISAGAILEKDAWFLER